MMQDLPFTVTFEDDVYIARWDDMFGGGITTQGDTLAELQAMVADAVQGYFDDGRAVKVTLHFASDPAFLVPA